MGCYCDHAKKTCGKCYPPIRPYWTVLIPFTATGATEWHPTESEGPFAVLTRGAFGSILEAFRWAKSRLNGQPFKLRLVEPPLHFQTR